MDIIQLKLCDIQGRLFERFLLLTPVKASFVTLCIQR